MRPHVEEFIISPGVDGFKEAAGLFLVHLLSEDASYRIQVHMANSSKSATIRACFYVQSTASSTTTSLSHISSALLAVSEELPLLVGVSFSRGERASFVAFVSFCRAVFEFGSSWFAEATSGAACLPFVEPSFTLPP